MATYTDDDQDRKKGEDRKDAQSSTQLDDERMCRFHDYVDGSAAAVRPSHHHEVVQTSTQSFQAGYVHQIVAAADVRLNRFGAGRNVHPGGEAIASHFTRIDDQEAVGWNVHDRALGV